MDPLPKKEALVAYYNNEYRQSDFSISIDNNKVIDLPIQIPWSGYSYARFKNFLDLAKASPEFIPPSSDSYFLDYGGYQGFFLLAVRQCYDCHVFNYDYSQNGIAFSQKALDIPSQLGVDISTDTFDRQFDYVSLIHVFEHLENPVEFLRHIKSKVIKDSGYLYIEVPNAYGAALSDPTHFSTFTSVSLKNTLTLGGFKTIGYSVHGNQKYGNMSDNCYANISILAVPCLEVSSATIEHPLSAKRFEKQLKDAYHAVYYRYCLRAVSTIGTELKRLFGLPVLILLEKLGIKFSKK